MQFSDKAVIIENDSSNFSKVFVCKLRNATAYDSMTVASTPTWTSWPVPTAMPLLYTSANSYGEWIMIET